MKWYHERKLSSSGGSSFFIRGICMKRIEKKNITIETFVVLILLTIYFVGMSKAMGTSHFFGTLMATAHDILLNTVFFIMALAIVANAFSSIMAEFGIMALVNRLISPLMRPLYGLPGTSALGAVTCFLSDNAAIAGLAREEEFIKYFTIPEKPLLVNLGTSYGMGLIVWTTMIAFSPEPIYAKASSLGVLGALIGSVVSVRLFRIFVKKYYKMEGKMSKIEVKQTNIREVRKGSYLQRALAAALEGGMEGVQVGIAIIPGVVFISTVIMTLTNNPPVEGFTGGPYEGIGLLREISGYIMPVIGPIFGLSSAEALAFPLTSLSAVGAAISLVPNMLAEGFIGPKDFSVFTAIGITYSGFLATHVALMDEIGHRDLVGKAILTHLIGGLVAGVFSNIMFEFLF